MSQISEASLPSTEFDDGSCQWCGLKNHGNVIDLDRRFGGRWAIEWDDIAMKGSQCPWHRRISCRYGFVSPTECVGRTLWGCATKPRQATMLESLCSYEWFTLMQRGDKEASVEFHIDHIDQIFSILKPIRR